MASFTRGFFFITIVFPTLFLSSQIHARESYFFGKFQRDRTHDNKNPSSVPLEANQKSSSVEVLPKQEQQQQDQDPRFIPESENGFGLYGHETTYNNNNNNEDFNKQYEENVNYEPYKTPSLSQTESYDSNNDRNNFNDKNFYNSNAYGRERSSSGYNGFNNNVEKQGMSDTRFMEKGKYYFDINDEENHGDLYKKPYRYKPSYAMSNYDQFGQDNNGGSFYDNNKNNNNEENSFQDPYNSKWEKNMMNEQEQEQEFGEEPRDQFVP